MFVYELSGYGFESRCSHLNSIIISNYDSLCYSIEPKVNKELSLNLLESMLELFVEVRMFSFARDIKEKHKVKNKKKKAWSLRTEIKKSSSSKDFDHWISSSIHCSLRPTTLNIGQKSGYFYSHTFKITLFAVKTRWTWAEEDSCEYVLTKIGLWKQVTK